MSFILNAIRKSEQQRQASQPDSLENRILEHQPTVQKKRPVWLIVIVIVNVIFLCYLVWLFLKEDTVVSRNTSVPIEMEVQLEDHVKPMHRSDVESVSGEEAEQDDQNQISISEQLRRKHSARQQQLKNIVPPKNPQISEQKEKVSTKEQSLVPPQIDEMDPPEDEMMDPLEDDEMNPPELEEIPVTKVVEVEKPQTEEFSFLSELAPEFRRKVPGLNINVYVYSENEENRFIMINMKKYVVGEDIGSGIMMKEIHMNGIVVEYRNKKFKIKRK
ncbi:MAG: general secretion pathway protein GspB [Methylococcaceae bacterium]